MTSTGSRRRLPRPRPVRDSKVPDGPALAFTAAHWTQFVGALRSGSL
ncbi:DUF397 domain-containing protein [Streptomyces sp. NPDC051784]